MFSPRSPAHETVPAHSMCVSHATQLQPGRARRAHRCRFCRWSDDDVAVVTGANKGIGFEIARQLGAQGLQVVVTSRDEGRGAEAMKQLQAKESAGRFEYCQADITDSASIQKCAQFLKDKYGKVAILVNNAGIAYKGSIFGADEAQTTIDCNLKGTREMCNAVLPLMGEGSRIVNVCSMCALPRSKCAPALVSAHMHQCDVPCVVCAHWLCT